jgi:hypothetical protein
MLEAKEAKGKGEAARRLGILPQTIEISALFVLFYSHLVKSDSVIH